MRRKQQGEPWDAGKRQAALVCLTILTWAGLCLRLERSDLSKVTLNLIASFPDFNLTRMLLLPGLYLLFRLAGKHAAALKKWTHLVPAVFFGLNMVLGYAFTKEGNWDMLWSLRDGQLIKTLWVWAAWSAVLDGALILLYHGLNRIQMIDADTASPAGKKGKLLTWYLRSLRTHSFLTPFLTLLLFWILHLLVAYPAMFMGDTWCMIVQAYSELGMTGVDYIAPENVMRAGVYINQHHPVFYTVCLHGFLMLGDAVFHSLNAGIFLFGLGQSVLTMAAFSWAVSTLSRKQVSGKWLLALLAYILLHPQIRNFLCLITKDSAYTACFLLLMTAFYRIRTGEGGRREWGVLCLSTLGVLLLRNEGKYVILVSGLLMALLDRRVRKQMLCYLAVAMVLSLGIYQGLYASLGFTKGSLQEALSVPFQQTARYLVEHPEKVTPEEREAIDGVLEYDKIAESYHPDTADAVKGLYRQEATTSELAAYFRAWAGMLLRHPETYLQATYGNYYEYLYPAEVRIGYYDYGWSAWMCDFANDKIEALGKRFELPDWNRSARYIHDSVIDAGLFNLPPFSLMMTPALYSWGLIALFFWVLGQRKGEGKAFRLALMMPTLVMFLVMFVGPTNGYYSRYMLTLTSFLPILMFMMLAGWGRKEQRNGR